MDWTNSYDPTIGTDTEIETETCAFDGLSYPWFTMVRGYFNESLDRYDKVYSGNLKEYKQLLETIAI
jgi:hypothetical protein